MSTREVTSPMFSEIEVSKRYRAVIEQILDQINSGALKPGQRLQSEYELSEILGVSRASIRQALGVLEYLGIVECRSGVGNFVSDKPPSELLRLSGQPLELPSPQAIVEARLLLEPLIASLAAVRRDENDLAALRSYIDKLQERIRAEPDATGGDISFHRALADASHNEALQAVMHIVTGWVGRIFIETNGSGEWLGASADWLQDHQRIYQAIADGDAEGAEAAMRAHLRHLKTTWD